MFSLKTEFHLSRPHSEPSPAEAGPVATLDPLQTFTWAVSLSWTGSLTGPGPTSWSDSFHVGTAPTAEQARLLN